MLYSSDSDSDSDSDRDRCPGCGEKGFYYTGHVCSIDSINDSYNMNLNSFQQPSWQPSSTAGYVLPSGVGYANSTRGVPESHMPANSSYFPSRIQHPQASSSTGYAYPVQSNFGGSVRQSRSTTRADTPPARSRSLSESSERSSASGDSGDLITDIGRLTP